MSRIQEEKIVNYIKNEIDNDKIIYQDFVSLRSQGLEFEELVLDIKKRHSNKKLEVEVILEVEKPFFNKQFLKNKNIINLDFTYKNYAIQIDSLEIEGYSELNKNFASHMEQLQASMREAEDEEKEIISKQMSKISNQEIEQKQTTKKLINEIETTLNSQLEELRVDIELLKNKINETVEEINNVNDSKSIKDILKNFRNDRTKTITIKSFVNNYNLTVYNKKLELTQLSYKIREAYLSLSLSKANEIPSILAETKQLKFNRLLIKEEYKRLKSFKSEVSVEVEDFVLDEFENLVLESYQLGIPEEEITVSKMDLYKVSLPRYKSLIKDLGVENV